MRLVDTKTLISLPKGTVYFYLGSGNDLDSTWSQELCIKGESILDTDWYSCSLDTHTAQDGAYYCPDDVPAPHDLGDLDLAYGRDGLFEYDRFFVVYDDKDVELLISALQNRRG